MFGRIFAAFQDRYVHKSIIFAIDGIASVASTLLAFLFTHLVVRFENLDSAIYLYLVLFSFIASFISIITLKTYAVAVRHTTIIEVGKLIGVAIFKVCIMLIFLFALISTKRFDIPFLTLVVMEIVDALLTLVALTVIRTVVSFVYKIMLKKITASATDRVPVYRDSFQSVSAGMMVIKTADYIF